MTKAINYFNQYFVRKAIFRTVLSASVILAFMTITEVNQNSVLAAINQNQSEKIQLAQARNRERGRTQQSSDRHNIPDPIDKESTNVLVETLRLKRVNDLFRTSGGLPGHIQQIQQEVNKIRNNARATSDATLYSHYVNALKTIRHSLISSARNASFDFERIEMELQPLISNLSLERRSNRLYVDGKEQ